MTKPLKPVGSGANGVRRPDAGGRAAGSKASAEGAKGAKEGTRVEARVEADPIDRIDPRTLPASGIAGKESPLTSVLWAGVDHLAALQGWEGQQGSLQVLFTALGVNEAPEHAFSADSRKNATRQFVSLGFDREEAKKLVDLLAFVVAGLYTDPGMKKSTRELKIEHEVERSRKALVEILKAPLQAREAKVAKLGADLLGKADQLQTRLAEVPAKDLPSALKTVEKRVRAVFEIVNVVSQHAL